MSEHDYSEVHQRLVALVETKLGDTYQFEVQAGTGQSSVNALRVYLSRVRKKLHEYGKKSQQFKVLCISIEKKPGDPTVEVVTLMRTTGQLKLQEEIKDLVALLGAGG